MQRNSFLISRAFRNYLRAALLSSACMQLTVMIDAVVAGHFIGPDALAAINLVMPLTTFVTALSTLFGLGPAIIVAKYIGRRQTRNANSTFSSAMYQSIFIGAMFGITLYLFLPQVSGFLCPNQQYLPYLMEYLQVLPFTFFLQMIVFTLVSLIEADGHPYLAARAVVLGCLLHMVLDVVLVKFLSIGTQGLALAMSANYLIVVLYFICRMKHEGVSYQWTRPRRGFIHVTMAGLKEGMPVMVNELIHSLIIFVVNTILIMHYGETELYFWTIFLQMLLLVMVIVDCAEGAILSIGSVLNGEDDRFGLNALVQRVWLMVGSIALIVVLIIWLFPNQVALLFSDRSDVPYNLPQALRILSLMLIPYALTTFMRSVFQVLGNRLFGVFISLGQLVLIVSCIYLSTRWNSQLLWWSFPIATWLLFGMHFLYLLAIRHMKRITDFAVIQPRPKKKFLDLSVTYNKESVTESIQRVCCFLQDHNVNPLIEMEVNICCEELMMNIVMFQTHRTRSYMDLSVVLEEPRVFFVLKDSGRPFNPVMTSSAHPQMLEDKEASLGLFLANRVCASLTHKYMYGLNVVFAEFDQNHMADNQTA